MTGSCAAWLRKEVLLRARRSAQTANHVCARQVGIIYRRYIYVYIYIYHIVTFVHIDMTLARACAVGPEPTPGDRVWLTA